MASAFILLNIIQAFAEFLPVSSSGHLILVENLYNISENGLEAFLHLPTAIAIGIVFFGTFINILKETKKWPILLAAIIPAGLVGFLLDDYIKAIFYSPLVIGINLIVWGIVMFFASYRQMDRKFKIQNWEKMRISSAFKIGLFQILALIPGTSRSGITTLTGVWQGVKPSESAKFSFIAGFPLIIAASLLGFVKLLLSSSTIISTIPGWSLALGLILSLVLGIVFVKLFTSKHTLLVMRYSGIYRVILGFLVLLWL